MAREKHKVTVAQGLNFDKDILNEYEVQDSASPIVKEHSSINEIENPSLESARTYSKYYDPHPKLGAKGGVIGKPPVKEKERKRSVSIQLSDTQKERYIKAAANDGRKWPDFVVKAIEEYIENHNL